MTRFICCPNSYFSNGLEKSFDFRPTSAQTSGEKNFREIFYWLKRTAFEFHGDSLGAILGFGSILWPKITKNTLLDFKIQKKTQLLNCVVRYMPTFKSVILNSRIEIRIFNFDSSKPVRKCSGNCILQINEQSPDRTKNIIKNPYSMEQIDFNIEFNKFE